MGITKSFKRICSLSEFMGKLLLRCLWKDALPLHSKTSFWLLPRCSISGLRVSPPRKVWLLHLQNGATSLPTPRGVRLGRSPEELPVVSHCVSPISLYFPGASLLTPSFLWCWTGSAQIRVWKTANNSIDLEDLGQGIVQGTWTPLFLC